MGCVCVLGKHVLTVVLLYMATEWTVGCVFPWGPFETRTGLAGCQNVGPGQTLDENRMSGRQPQVPTEEGLSLLGYTAEMPARVSATSFRIAHPSPPSRCHSPEDPGGGFLCGISNGVSSGFVG